MNDLSELYDVKIKSNSDQVRAINVKCGCEIGFGRYYAPTLAEIIEAFSQLHEGKQHTK